MIMTLQPTLCYHITAYSNLYRFACHLQINSFFININTFVSLFLAIMPLKFILLVEIGVEMQMMSFRNGIELGLDTQFGLLWVTET